MPIFLGLALSISAQTPDQSVTPSPNSSEVVNQGAELGHSVAVDGAYTVAGAPFELRDGRKAGKVKVFNSTTGALLFVLQNPSSQSHGWFGCSVAISGARVVVGSPFDDVERVDAGRVYVYDLSGPTPTVPKAILSNPKSVAGEVFGKSVAISGSRVIVGAYTRDLSTLAAGTAYVYDLLSATPTAPVVTLTNASPTKLKVFDVSVAISGARVVVGAYWYDASVIGSGTVCVYDLSKNTPTEPIAKLVNPDPAQGDLFGFSVAISGMRVVVGAPLDDTGTLDAGSAYVFNLSSGSNFPEFTLNHPVPAKGNGFGCALAIAGTQLVVGASYDKSSISSTGCVHILDLSSSTPTVPLITLSNPTPAENDRFGISVAHSGTRILVGAPKDDSTGLNCGSAYIYDISGTKPNVPVVSLHNSSPP